jgi:6-phosphogluconate dehydrogenase
MFSNRRFNRFSAFVKREKHMELGMIGLGRMGSNMVQRLLRAGHQCVAYDVHPEAAQPLVKDGAVASTSIEEFAGKVIRSRVSMETSGRPVSSSPKTGIGQFDTLSKIPEAG